MGFAASGGNATRQLAAVRGVGPRRVSSWRRRRRRDPRGLAPPRGTGVRRGSRQTQRSASEPAGPTVAADDAPTSCLGDNGTASLPWALSTATCSAQVRRPASRPSCPSFPASSQPQRPTPRCRQICAGTTSSCSNFPDGSVHFRPFPLEKISPAPGNRIRTAIAGGAYCVCPQPGDVAAGPAAEAGGPRRPLGPPRGSASAALDAAPRGVAAHRTRAGRARRIAHPLRRAHLLPGRHGPLRRRGCRCPTLASVMPPRSAAQTPAPLAGGDVRDPFLRRSRPLAVESESTTNRLPVREFKEPRRPPSARGGTVGPAEAAHVGPAHPGQNGRVLWPSPPAAGPAAASGQNLATSRWCASCHHAGPARDTGGAAAPTAPPSNVRLPNARLHYTTPTPTAKETDTSVAERRPSKASNVTRTGTLGRGPAPLESVRGACSGAPSTTPPHNLTPHRALCRARSPARAAPTLDVL